MPSAPQLTWDEAGAPHSLRFDDRYFSAHDGAEEAAQVFMQGNRLPARWHDADLFHIAELGFGTGLNFFVTLAAWYTYAPPTASLHYTAFELAPLPAADMRRALARWPELADLAAPWLDAWPSVLAEGSLLMEGVELELVVGDARATLPAWPGFADAWYLDGFSPAKNPELWEAGLLAEVYLHTMPGGTFSTYTAAGFVRRNLLYAGFQVARVPGFAGKKERLQGRKREG